MTVLPGINFVAFLSAELLPNNVLFKHLAGLPVGIFAQPSSVPLIGDALCETEAEADNNDSLEKATLSFSTPQRLDLSGNLAFVFKSVHAGTFLLGTKEGPFPVISFKATTGTPDNDKAVYKYSVVFQNKVAIVNCYT